jgi:hypothetical protein
MMVLNEETMECAEVFAQSMAMCLGVYVQAKRGEGKQVERSETIRGDQRQHMHG